MNVNECLFCALQKSTAFVVLRFIVQLERTLSVVPGLTMVRFTRIGHSVNFTEAGMDAKLSLKGLTTSFGYMVF